MMRYQIPNSSADRGISLLQMIAVIAVLGMVAAMAVPTISRFKEGSERAKLESDIATLNHAVQVYVANGGNLDGVTSAAAVINKLKSVRNDGSVHAGMRNSMIDPRLQASTAELTSLDDGDFYAQWNEQDLKFETGEYKGSTPVSAVRQLVPTAFDSETESNPVIVGFELNASLALQDFGTEERNLTLALNSKDGWIWEYQDSLATRPPGATEIPLTNPTPVIPPPPVQPPVSNNRDPSAVADTFQIDEDTTLSGGNVLINDSDPDGDPIVIVEYTSPSSGVLTLNGNGSLSYQPENNYYGTAAFTYAITDGNGGRRSASVAIQVAPVNDAPMLTLGSNVVDYQLSPNILSNPDFELTDAGANGGGRFGVITQNWDLVVGTAELFVTNPGDPQYMTPLTHPAPFQTSPAPSSGDNYAGFHSGGARSWGERVNGVHYPETLVQHLSNVTTAGQTYTFRADFAETRVWPTSRGGFGGTTSVAVYGIHSGVPYSSIDLWRHDLSTNAGVDFLTRTGRITGFDWSTHTLSFTSAAAYDRLVFVPLSRDINRNGYRGEPEDNAYVFFDNMQVARGSAIGLNMYPQITDVDNDNMSSAVVMLT
ncbi:MAG: cadherin-like domain-containing protein, partial [Verrucomicrobiota bacterium]